MLPCIQCLLYYYLCLLKPVTKPHFTWSWLLHSVFTRPIIAYIAHQTMRCLQNRSRIIGLGLLEKRLCIMTCLFGVTETKLNIFRMKKRRFWAVSDGKQLNNGVTSHIRKLPIVARKIWLVKGSGSGFGSGFQMFWVLPVSDHASSECV